jgi:DNA-binding winged helix-turn-helix (wHTH) protein/tetratricopeptide (TPR) repeat protein
MSRKSKHIYEFGPFRLDANERVLIRAGKSVPLTLKAFDTLLALVENSGRVVEKEELLNRVWPDAFVEEGVLSVNIFMLRKALAEGNFAQFIETVPRRGYRFTAHVKEIIDESSQANSPLTIATYKSVAVLPLKSRGDNSDDEYLGLGIADALITRLGKIKSLVVRPTSTVRKYAGLDVDAMTVGREMMVASVLEGSIRRADERLRVTVQLVSVSDGVPLWAEKFDEQFTDIFTVEDRISDRVAEALMIEITGEEKAQLSRRATSNSEAYRLYIKGRFFWNKRTEEGLEKGIEYFKRAIDVDSKYALAYAGLADSYLVGSSSASPVEAMSKAKAAAIKAVELDQYLAEAHTSLARIKMSFDWDWAGAESEFEQALELNPNYSTARQWYANLLLATGRAKEAIAQIRIAQELDPASVVINSAAGWVHYLAREYEQAIAAYRKALEMDPNFVLALRESGMIYGQMGMYREAIAAIRKAIAIGGQNPIVLMLLARVLARSGSEAETRKIIDQLMRLSNRSYVSPHVFASVYIGLDEREKALIYLDKAYEDRSSPLIWLKLDPWFDSVRNDERFKLLLNRINLL